MTDHFTYRLKISIQNIWGVQRDFLETVASNEELSPEELRKIAVEMIEDAFPDWCLHTFGISPT